MNLYLGIAGIVVCIALSAFFSASEMAYSSCNTMRLENARAAGSKKAAAAMRIVENYDDALSAILIGNNLVNISSSSLASVLVMALLGDGYTWLATLLITVLVIIFGETMPKIIAKQNANTLAERFSGVITALMIILKPLILVVVALVRLVTFFLKGEGEGSGSGQAVEELQSIIETAEDEDVLDEDQTELIQAAIDFSEIAAYEAMTARVDVQAIDIDNDWDEILSAVETSPFSRLPVYEGSIDHVIGVLYQNHFLKALTESTPVDLRRLLMPPCYVYKTMKLPAVLSQLRRAKQQLAIVTDEYGGTLGVLSMEDVLEQIVGDIWDESDVVEQEVVERASGEYELDGDMILGDFCELLGISEELLEADSETVGGWTVEKFGAFPNIGEYFEHENLKVTVLAMDGRRVEKVLVQEKNSAFYGGAR